MGGLRDKLNRLKRSGTVQPEPAEGGDRADGIGPTGVEDGTAGALLAADAAGREQAEAQPEVLPGTPVRQERLEDDAELTGGNEPGVRADAEAAPLEMLDPRWGRLGVRELACDGGSFLLRELRFGLDQPHGDHRLGELEGLTELFSAMTVGSGGAGAKAGSADLEVESLLFIDTETTGLGVGAGNVPFMIGLGYYEENSFLVQQLFIRNPAEERAMLVYLGQLMERRSRLVTYNGKSFDWPLIKNRFVLNRLPLQTEDPEHFDLLYPSRGLWRNTLPSCRLSIVEKSRLGLSRIDDLPGSMAPEMYFLFLAERNPAVLMGIFEHNEKDVLTLAALSVHLAKLFGGTIPLEGLDDEELYRMGAWMEKLGEEAKARAAIDLLAGRAGLESSPHTLLCAAFYKRRQRYDLAVPLWRLAAAAAPSPSGLASLEPLIELAMHYEHRERDAAEALRLAEQALERASQRVSLSRGDPKARAAREQLLQRVARLQRKAASAAAAAKPPADAAAQPAPRRRRAPAAAQYERTLFT